MGKASKWFRGLLGLKKPDASTSTQPPKQPQTQKEKRRWSFVKSYREKDYTASACTRDDLRHEAVDPDKHAIAVAAATAAVAEAAVAAAQAAAAVVRLTSSGRCAPPGHVSGSFAGARGAEDLAALKIQSAFRGYLARRALRALKGLVKIQALVRGHIERKRSAERMRRMQALFRAQARARAERSQISESSQSSSKSSHFQHPGPATPEKVEQYVRVKSIKRDQSPVFRRNGSRSSGRSAVYQEREHVGRNQLEYRMIDAQRGPLMRNFPPSDESNDKILEVDTMKPLLTTKQSIPVHHPFHPTLASDQISHRTRSITATQDSTVHQTAPTPSSSEVQSLTPLKFPYEVEEGQFCTADNSPQFFSASSKGGSSRRSPFTPSKSDGSRSFLSGYSDHPNYMAYTESSRAKVRSLSAPRQRPQFEKSSSMKRYSIHSYGDSRQKVPSSLQASFASKAYPGSGRLDRLGMPVIRGDGFGYRY